MFRNNKDSKSPETIQPVKDPSPRPRAGGGTITSVAPGAGISGSLETAGNLVVEGRIEGSVKADGNVQIGASGVVEAEVNGNDITVAGTVKGRIYAAGKVILLSGARVEGDIHAQSLKIEDSVFFQGGCVMGDDARRAHAGDAALPKSVTAKAA